MKIYRRIKEWMLSGNKDNGSVRPLIFERLESRIMLSGDGFLSCMDSSYTSKDYLIDETQQVIQYSDSDGLSLDATAASMIDLERTYDSSDDPSLTHFLIKYTLNGG